jgi:hypothetical protein
MATSLLGCDLLGTALADRERRGEEKVSKSSPRSQPEDARSEGLASARDGRFTFAYPQTRNPKHAAVREGLQEAGLLEGLTKELNATVTLRRDLQIRFETCDKVNAWYTSAEPAIVFCYDLLEHAARVYTARGLDDKQREIALNGFIMFVMTHELGHALVHELELLVTGRQEDAVDQLATLLMLASKDDEIVVGALLAASYFAMTGAQGGAAAELPFWDEHSLGQQRFYDTACLIHGSNPQRTGEIVGSGLLPAARAQRCAGEYAQVNAAWRTMLAPHLRDEKRFWD